ncbi:hypothetical protein [Geomonas sp.]|uniref:hypothetical protein n=1 Tax=Geomonas sp. TaxID=2651584 RepID=UPI002B4913F4|nr:hypothetical protein [Geomonas sp.]HJV36367.1 hypothetical protein [Geomonas sp.]
MNNFRVIHPDRIIFEELLAFDFSGNKPALPPLTTEEVAALVYVEEEDEDSF